MGDFGVVKKNRRVRNRSGGRIPNSPKSIGSRHFRSVGMPTSPFQRGHSNWKNRRRLRRQRRSRLFSVPAPLRCSSSISDVLFCNSGPDVPRQQAVVSYRQVAAAMLFCIVQTPCQKKGKDRKKRTQLFSCGRWRGRPSPMPRRPRICPAGGTSSSARRRTSNSPTAWQTTGGTPVPLLFQCNAKCHPNSRQTPH